MSPNDEETIDRGAMKDDKKQGAIDVPPLHKEFFYKALCFAFKNRERGEENPLEEMLLRGTPSESLEYDLFGVQESSVVHNAKKARDLAFVLIADDGSLRVDVLKGVIAILQKSLYPIGPYYDGDAIRNEHILKALVSLHDNKGLRELLMKVTKPSSHHAEKILRDTLIIDASTTLTDAHARRAALSAWLCFLRQNVGSCFATAPAIIIQQEQPENLFQDIVDLFATGRMTRTFGGVEHSVPLSGSWGVANIKKPVMITKTEKDIATEIWRAPGVLHALRAAGVVDDQRRCKGLIVTAIQGIHPEGGTFWTTTETLIRKVLLEDLGITEKDLADNKKAPQGMFEIHKVSISSKANNAKKKSKTALCGEYHEKYEAATKAFNILTDNPLLKAWEYTIASFCDTKTDFSRWNLYSSLGLEEDSPGGIGECLYNKIKEKLDEVNRESNEYHEQYNALFPHVKQLEVRIKHAKTEQDAQWIRSEYKRSVGELNNYQAGRDEAHQRAKLYAELFNFIISKLLEMFPQYFQEVYDADIHDVKTGLYDDSPAGFRLLYKHGRTDASLWTHIYEEDVFIDSLASFFVVIENDIIGMPELEGFERDISEIITSIVMHVKTTEFLESAFYRMAIAHNVSPVEDPLNNLEKVDKKPWVYTSGGTMSVLIQCYYRLDDKPKEIDRWVENEVELCDFFIDIMKEMPAKTSDMYVENHKKTMLMHSPTHAFILKPGVLRDGWKSELYTYTWVRDTIITPQQTILAGTMLDNGMIAKLLSIITEKIPADDRKALEHTFIDIPKLMGPQDFREYVCKKAMYAPKLKENISAEDIDSILYTSLPMTPGYAVKDNIGKLIKDLPMLSEEEKNRILDAFEEMSGRHPAEEYVTADELQEVCKALILIATGKTAFEDNYNDIINMAAQKNNLALSAPIFFADTNWEKNLFGFVVNPGTGRLEVWNFDATKRHGTPMTHWRRWLDGSNKTPTWGVYTLPHQYGG